MLMAEHLYLQKLNEYKGTELSNPLLLIVDQRSAACIIKCERTKHPENRVQPFFRIYFFIPQNRGKSNRTGVKLVRRYKYITFQDRRTLAAAYERGERAADIAERLGVTVATVYRELKRGESTDGSGNLILDRNQRPAYSPVIAQQTVQANFKRRGRTTAESNAGV